MFNHSAEITLVKHIVVRLIQLLLSLHCSVRLAKQRTQRENQSPLTAKDEREKADEIFGRGMFFKAAQRVSPRQESTEETNLQVAKTAQSVLWNLGTCPPTFWHAPVHTPYLTGLCIGERESHSRGCPSLCLYPQGKDQHGMMQGVASDNCARAHLAWN